MTSLQKHLRPRVCAIDIIGHESKEVSANCTHIDAASKRAAFEKLPDITSA